MPLGAVPAVVVPDVQGKRHRGWTDAAIEADRARFGNFGRHIHMLPDSYRRLSDGEEFAIGAHTWRVVVGAHQKSLDELNARVCHERANQMGGASLERKAISIRRAERQFRSASG